MSRNLAAAAIPARISVTDLARALGTDLAILQAALTEKDESSGPDDILDAPLSEAVARALGKEVRVEARDLAIECLYEMDCRQESEPPHSLPGRVERFVLGVTKERESLDKEIEAASQHWAIARMPMVDRAILRLAVWELKNDPDTPAAVVVSEAVRLANAYSTARSGTFVNGVLGTLAKTLR